MRSVLQQFSVASVRTWFGRPIGELLPVAFAILVGLGCLAVAAYWVHRILPSMNEKMGVAVPTVSTPPRTGAGTKLFGAEPGQVREAKVLVSGVARSTDGSGIAIVSTAGAPARLVRVGQSVSPGLELVEIKSRAIVLRRGGEMIEAVMTPSDKLPSLKVSSGDGGVPATVSNVARLRRP